MFEGPIQDLIDELARLPGIGPKGAQRIAFHILTADKTDVERLADSLRHVAENVRFCERCFNISEADNCRICRDPRRDQTAICVVEESKDVMAIERTNEFRGLYHVLGGAISPLDGVGPDDLRIRELVARVATSLSGRAPDAGDDTDGDAPTPVEEVILAMNPTVEGDTTAYYVGQMLSPFGVRVTRIARGLPIGGDLEFADEATLSRALEGRSGL